MHGEDVADVDLEARLLAHLAARGVADVFVPFDVAAGDAPAAGVGAAGAPPEQDGIGVAQDDGDADGGVAVGDPRRSSDTASRWPAVAHFHAAVAFHIDRRSAVRPQSDINRL